jgi:hypothetical protein
MNREASATGRLLAGMIDYAGLYPPAGLDMHTAVKNYLRYKSGHYAWALGRFVVDVKRVDEFCKAAGEDYGDVRLSLIAPADFDRKALSGLIERGIRVEAVEFKIDSFTRVELHTWRSPGVETYMELPAGQTDPAMLDAISAAGVRAKLRMGGVVAEAFPATKTVAGVLTALAERKLAFKATAGLHHAIRARHRFTYEPDSPRGMMHGFVNLFCAAALIHFGKGAHAAESVLEEQDAKAWHVTPQAIEWHQFHCSAERIGEVRQKFMTSFGSCSCEEPLRDLEALGWL